MRTARIGQQVVLTGARLENPAGNALHVSGTEVAADMPCQGAVIIGGIKLTGARIRSHFDLDQARVLHPGASALDARELQAGELSLRPAEPIEGTVDLSHARVEILRDDPAFWPGTLNLDGLTYLALEPQLPARRRLPWLARHPRRPCTPALRAARRPLRQDRAARQARRVLHAREQLQRQSRPPLARAWSLLQDVTVAYRYQPWRALIWLALLLAAGSIVFTAAPPPPLHLGAAPHFNAIIYTLDLLLPVVDLGQKHAFNPAGTEQWFSYLLTAAGWILATTIAAGVLGRQ